MLKMYLESEYGGLSQPIRAGARNIERITETISGESFILLEEKNINISGERGSKFLLEEKYFGLGDRKAKTLLKSSIVDHCTFLILMNSCKSLHVLL